MLIISRKQNQEVVFPNLGVRIEVSKIRGNTVCLGIDAPKDIAILRGELENLRSDVTREVAAPLQISHELRGRLNTISLCLHVMKENQDANLPIDSKILTRALRELHTIEEICSCGHAPNPFVERLDQLSPHLSSC